ncbi:FAD-dependent oxidoreductase [Candidatus Dojkabacteria bacterium HGW-Dojkabacteria-1]|uniref:FAD-dependent oxidoreductase n=1 Tax=Candidatus Dojkabacteria bacterium HGW-Dojkabacteria-1 TaxID=2013761 RepID=A0A2N2F405_9BACT|nr:MAG: FAD-dependent oxidoreductase [Candidatus Dojkabacteria bacterium HGW-Dojkabacteria-1]
MKIYDYIVVGAGPAGMFATYEILKKKPKAKILLIDMGKKIKDRKPTEVMIGIGGAGTFSDGKLTLTANLSHEKAFHLISKYEYQKILDYVDDTFNEFGIDSEYFPKETEELKKLIEEAQINDIELVTRKARHVGTDKLKAFVQRFEEYLVQKGVEILDSTKVTDITVKEGSITGVECGEKKIKGKKVLLAPGRVNARWLQTLADKYGIQYIYDKVEVGVRVEFPSSVMKRQADTLYETVYRVRTKTYQDIVRTFCSCPNGLVAIEEYENYVCVNGHSNSDHDSKNSNFAFLCEVNLKEPLENSIAYAKSIAELTSLLGGGKPILQSVYDLRDGRRSTWSRLEKSFVEPSLKDVVPGDISMGLPHRIVLNILEGLELLDKVMPGINAGSTLLYAPEVKFRSSKISTKKNMETSIKGLFVAGDAAGLSGSITGAAVTGVMAGRGMA